jgi:hypothetical protein
MSKIVATSAIEFQDKPPPMARSKRLDKDWPGRRGGGAGFPSAGVGTGTIQTPLLV